MLAAVMTALTPWSHRTRQADDADDRASEVVAAAGQTHTDAQAAIAEARLAVELAAVETAFRRSRGAS